MRNKPIQADQLIPTSATPPPEAGFYRIDRQTIGVVGNMSFRDPNTQVVMPVGKGAIPFPDFSPRLLASLVANSTAACTSGVVTVTATSHLIAATVYNGWKFYYPGSPSLAAGWYDNFSRVDANTVTFSAPNISDFVSESVNSASAFTSEVTFQSITLPPNTLNAGDLVEIPVYRHSNNTTGNKGIKILINSDILSYQLVTSTASIIGVASYGGIIITPTSAYGFTGSFGTLTASAYVPTIATATSQSLSLVGSVSAAGMTLGMIAGKVRIG